MPCSLPQPGFQGAPIKIVAGRELCRERLGGLDVRANEIGPPLADRSRTSSIGRRVAETAVVATCPSRQEARTDPTAAPPVPDRRGRALSPMPAPHSAQLPRPRSTPGRRESSPTSSGSEKTSFSALAALPASRLTLQFVRVDLVDRGELQQQLDGQRPLVALDQVEIGRRDAERLRHGRLGQTESPLRMRRTRGPAKIFCSAILSILLQPFIAQCVDHLQIYNLQPPACQAQAQHNPYFPAGTFGALSSLAFAAQCKSQSQRKAAHSISSDMPRTDEIGGDCHDRFLQSVPSRPEGRFDGVERPYTPEDVKRLRGSVQIRYIRWPRMGANRLWQLIHEEDFVNALGALSGNQAMQMVRAGLKAIYLSGWQVAADANTASAMYPDQSLYPANAAPELAKRINRTLQRADQIETGRRQRPVGRHLVRADRRRCRSRLRRAAQRLRDHEGLHRGRCRRRPLRGPARVGEEVRPSRRQGADPDGGPYPQPQRRASCGRRDGHADAGDCPHRCGGRQAADLRYRRARPAFRRLRRRPHRRRLLSGQERDGPPASPAPSPTRPIAT
jgi:hypothetical protein